MTKKIKESKALEKAETRVKGMKDIGASINLGNGLSLENYAAKTQALRDRIDAFNAMQAALEEAKQEIAEAEAELNDMSEHMLLGVAAIYGKQSKEYERSGGKRKTNGGWIDRN